MCHVCGIIDGTEKGAENRREPAKCDAMVLFLNANAPCVVTCFPRIFVEIKYLVDSKRLCCLVSRVSGFSDCFHYMLDRYQLSQVAVLPHVKVLSRSVSCLDRRRRLLCCCCCHR